MDSLIELLKSCTVQVGDPEEIFGTGTGFFFAPSKIITCYHVIEDYGSEIPFLYKGQKKTAKLDFPCEEYDFAILEVDTIKHNKCVFFDSQIEFGDTLYAYGFSEENTQGDPVTLEFEGIAKNKQGTELLKLKRGLITSGMSGSPILSVKSGKVCGITVETRDKEFPNGGYGLILDHVFEELPTIQKENQIFHLNDNEWSNSLPQNQIGIGRLDSSRNKNHFKIFDSPKAPSIDELFIEPKYFIINQLDEDDTDKNLGVDFVKDAIKILEEENLLIISGPYGSGKTLCCKYLHDVLWKEKNHETVFISTSDLATNTTSTEFRKLLDEKIESTRKKVTFIVDGFEESNKLKKNKESLLDEYQREIIDLACNERAFVIINFRNLVFKDTTLTGLIYESLLVDYSRQNFTFLALNYFDSLRITNWLDSYFNILAKAGDERRFFDHEINDLHKNLKSACSNPLLLYFLCETFCEQRKSIKDINLFYLYNQFVLHTIYGKFKGHSSAIKEIRKFYRTFLKELAIEILKEQERIIIKRTDDIDLDEAGDILIDPNLDSYSASTDGVKEKIEALAKEYLGDELVSDLSNRNLVTNVFACYFIEISNNRWSFRDNNILFFFISEILFEAVDEVLKYSKECYDKLEEIDLDSVYEKFKPTLDLQIHPLSLDILFYKIDDLSKDDTTLLTEIITNLIKSGHVLSISKKNLASLNTSKINLDIWLSLLYIHINRASYVDKELIFFFKRLNWLVSAGKIVNKNYQFIVRRFLRKSLIKGVEFRRINCDGYNFDFSIFIDVKFIQVKFFESRMNNVKFKNTQFALCDFSKISLDRLEGEVEFENCRLDKVYINDTKETNITFKRCYIKKLEIQSKRRLKESDIKISFTSCDIDNLIFKNQFSSKFELINTFYSTINIDRSEITLTDIKSYPKGQKKFKNISNAIIRQD